MPKIVDRAARRTAIVDAYLAVVVKHGFAAATAKAVCEEMGVSIGSLWHYFDSLDDVVQQAALTVFERDVRRIEALEGTGLSALQRAIGALLPIEHDARVEAQLVVAFWSALPGSAVSRFGTSEVFVEPLARLLERAVDDGDLRVDAPPRLLAEALNQLLDGAQVAHVLEPELGPARHRARVAAMLAPWLTERPSSASDEIRGWLIAG
jgi:AcrR family transcriptional regulator